MLLVTLVLARTVIAALAQLRARVVEDTAGSVFDLRSEIVERVAAPSGATLFEFKALEFVDRDDFARRRRRGFLDSRRIATGARRPLALCRSRSTSEASCTPDAIGPNAQFGSL